MTFLVKDSRPRSGRAGFTLIELMVVMSIIGILTALAASGVFAYIGAQKKANTQNLVRTLNSALQRQWSAVTNLANRQPMPPAVLALAGYNSERARVILQKLYLRQAFPMSFQEALSPIVVNAGGQVFVLNPLSTYQSALSKVNVASNQFAITGVSNSASPTITTSTPHGYSVGQYVWIVGVAGATGVNGTWQVTSASGSTFTIATGAPGAYASGGGTTGTTEPAPYTIQPNESATLLLLALERDNVLDRSSLGGGSIGTSTVAPLVDYLCDPWKSLTGTGPSPLTFARWPYANPWLNSSTFLANISSVSSSSSPISTTITTTSSHGLVVGQFVWITGVNGVTGINGTWQVITTPSSTSFTVVADPPGGYSGGGSVNIIPGQGPTATQNGNDLGDPNGTLSVYSWWNTGNRQIFEAICHPLPYQGTGVALLSYQLVPMIVSCGPDRTCGLDLNSFAEDGLGGSNDNITSASLSPNPG